MSHSAGASSLGAVMRRRTRVVLSRGLAAGLAAVFVFSFGVKSAKASSSQCTTVGWFCQWTGNNYTGHFYGYSTESAWQATGSSVILSLWNHRSRWVTWISNVPNYDTSTNPNRAEACVEDDSSSSGINPSAYPGLTDYYYPVGPGSGQIANNVHGVYLSDSRTSCPAGTQPDGQ
jgi:Peptidase inhibitor family I36